ncbi:unnamed protein product [Allacma fusca]|uniref:WD repeat-containing protein 18 n=1 Tax=Allacma fusca TaxID=39272 RepID=A0A8J2KD50_9HEXA|nr:unnamed protein product [Allacma fusca]
MSIVAIYLERQVTLFRTACKLWLEMEVLVSTDRADDNISITFWNPSSGTKLLTLRGPPAHPSSLCNINDEGFAVVETNKPFIHFWQTGHSLQTSRRILCPGKPCAAAVYPDGSYFAVAIEEKISIWQVGTGRIVTTVTSAHFRAITVLKFNSNGSFLVSGGQDGVVNAWNFLQLVSDTLPTPTYTWSDHTLPVSGIHIGAGGQKATIYTSSADRTCKIYSLLTGTLLLSISFPTALTAVAVDTAGNALYLGAKNGLIYQIKLQSPPRSVEHHILSEAAADALYKKHTNAITGLAVSGDGRILVSGDEDGNIFLWDVPSRQSIRTIQQAQLSAAVDDDTNKSTRRITNIAFWMGNPENLKGARKPTVHFPEVPKLLEAQDDNDNPVVRLWNRCRQDESSDPNDSSKSQNHGSLLAEISKLKMELVKNESINKRLHEFCAENILGLQDKPTKTTKNNKKRRLTSESAS